MRRIFYIMYIIIMVKNLDLVNLKYNHMRAFYQSYLDIILSQTLHLIS